VADTDVNDLPCAVLDHKLESATVSTKLIGPAETIPVLGEPYSCGERFEAPVAPERLHFP